MVYPIGSLLGSIALSSVKRVRGLENMPKNTPFIVASNHSSLLDPPILLLIIAKYLKRRAYFISSAPLILDLAANIIFGEFGGSIRLKKKDKEGFIQSAIKHLREGHIVVIFPEGMTNREPGLRRGKTGVARLVLNANVPLIPIGVKGTFELLYNFRKWVLKPKKTVTISIGKPLYFKGYYGKGDCYGILRRITTTIMQQIDLLTDQKYEF